MKIKYTKYLGLFAILAILTSSAYAQNDVFKLSGETDAEAFDDEVVGAINQVISLIYYLLYAAGAIFMGIGAFNLKKGDVPGFAKNFLGGAALFCSPLVVQALQNLGQNT